MSERTVQETPLAIPYEIVGTFCSVTEAQRLLMALWSAGTHTYTTFSVYPRIYFTAEGPESGKSTSMEIVTQMSRNPLCVDYSTQGSVHTWLDEHPETTIGLDEADGIFGTTGRSVSTRSNLLAILNGGYARRGKVLVVRSNKAVLMPVYCPMALAGIGRLPRALQTRCAVIQLESAIPECEYIPELYEDDLTLAGKLLSEWLNTTESQEALKSAPKLAEGIDGSPRFRQIMAPLAAIAELAGIGDRFREAVREVQSGIAAKPLRTRAELLIDDIVSVWPEKRVMVRSEDLITRLQGHDSRRWESMSTSRIGQLILAEQLREVGIETTTSNGTRGYRAEDFGIGKEQNA